MKYKNLKIIGTSHISKQSIEEIRKAIEEEKPDIIALELDKDRYFGLMSGKKRKAKLSDMFRVGVKGYLFSMLGQWAEEKMGKSVGIKPGAEMKSAAKIAKKEKIKLAFIDQHIEITLKKLSKSISWKEKWNFVKDIVGAFFGKKIIEFDLTKVPGSELIEKLLDEVKGKYPNVHRVLVSERNEFMAKKLLTLMKNDEEKKILAIVGAGHKKEIMRIVKDKFNKVEYSYSVSY